MLACTTPHKCDMLCQGGADLDGAIEDAALQALSGRSRLNNALTSVYAGAATADASHSSVTEGTTGGTGLPQPAQPSQSPQDSIRSGNAAAAGTDGKPACSVTSGGCGQPRDLHGTKAHVGPSHGGQPPAPGPANEPAAGQHGFPQDMRGLDAARQPAAQGGLTRSRAQAAQPATQPGTALFTLHMRSCTFCTPRDVY
jgi:hypothetical protein